MIARLLKKADEIQHLQEDLVDSKNLLTPLNRAELVQSLGNNLQHTFIYLFCVLS